MSRTENQKDSDAMAALQRIRAMVLGVGEIEPAEGVSGGLALRLAGGLAVVYETPRDGCFALYRQDGPDRWTRLGELEPVPYPPAGD